MIAWTLVAALALGSTGSWRSYEVYRPHIERHVVNDTYAQPLKYNHDSSVAWFGDRWFCLWNANTPPAEGEPGQLNYVSTSRDGKTWTPPRAAFSSAECCENPVPCPTGTQWQPNLIVVGGELWALWDQNSRDKHAGCYLSRLTSPDGRWRNRRLLWDGEPKPVIDGKPFRPFPTQNPTRLRSGRILAPVTLIGPEPEKVPAGVSGWWAREKRNSVLYTDDGGTTWRVSPGAVQPSKTWAQWEPTVWQQPDGTVNMFARNNDSRRSPKGGPTPTTALLWSKSTDDGATWTPHGPVPIETVVSRMHVMAIGGDRVAMVHNDWPAGQFVADRYNLALYFTRGGGIDFVAGPGVSGYEPVVAYPQMWRHDGRLLVSYSQGRAFRSIKVAHVWPLPDPGRYYLFPRSNTPPPASPQRVDGAYRFSGMQHLATRRPVAVSEEGFSAGAWVRPLRGGALIDTRPGSPPKGFVWGLSTAELKPFIYIHTPENNITSSLRLERGAWNYVGVTVDNRTGIVWFFVDGERHGIVYVAPGPKPLGGTSGHLGAKRFASSSVQGLVGDLRSMAIYPKPCLDRQGHARLAKASRCGGKLDLSEVSSVEPLIRFDAADAAGVKTGFVLPEADDVGVETVEVDGRPALRLRGPASAGVDLDVNDRGAGDVVAFGFRARVEGNDRVTLCTVGDAEAPARLVVEKGQARWRLGSVARACGSCRAGAWIDVALRSGGGESSVRLGKGDWVALDHRPMATWLYLGDGYAAGRGTVDGVLVVDVGSVRSRVVRVGR